MRVQMINVVSKYSVHMILPSTYHYWMVAMSGTHQPVSVWSCFCSPIRHHCEWNMYYQVCQVHVQWVIPVSFCMHFCFTLALQYYSKATYPFQLRRVIQCFVVPFLTVSINVHLSPTFWRIALLTLSWLGDILQISIK